MKFLGRLHLILAAAMLTFACATPPPPPGVVELTVTAAPDLNPDASGRASPVVLRVYQLTSPVKFSSADFFLLFEKEQATLGPDLLGREEVAVSPGETKKITVNLKPDATTIGVAASFRAIDQAEWRATVDVPQHKTTPVTATLEKLRVTLAASS